MMITLQLPGWFMEEAKKTISSGEQYALEMRRVLIDKYGADPGTIDQETLNEQGTGQIIQAVIDGCEPIAPDKLLADRLRHYSDIGLKKHGLTRGQYNKVKDGE